MASKAEQCVSRALRAIVTDLPDGASVLESEHRSELLSSLEYFLPEVLRERYAEWEHESLDGLCPLVTRKSGDAEVTIFGLCILLSDQTLTPIHVRVQAASAADTVSSLACKLGEASAQGMVRTPWPAGSTTDKLVHALQGRADTIAWVYQVEFGRRRFRHGVDPNDR